MDKIILHCDLNNFFASCECIGHPELKNYPMAVCGSQEDRHGIVLAKNDLAKKAGVLTAETIWQAKKACPELIIVSPSMEKYIKISKDVRKIYSEYTDLIEPFGIDECWLDVTGSTLLFGDGETIANTIRERIKAEVGLTISVGVSFNKIFAKLGSDMKKPDAITIINKSNYQETIWNLPATDLIGIGHSTYEKIVKYGIRTIGDLAKSEKQFLVNILGSNGEAIWCFANGVGSDKVAHEHESSLPKSVGNSTTCNHDLKTVDEVWNVLYQLCDSVTTRLRDQKLLASAVQISVKDINLTVSEFQSFLPFASRYPKDLCVIGIELFKKNYSFANPVRSVGIKAIKLIPDDEAVQCSFIYNQKKIIEHDALEEKVYNLRKRYGDSAVLRGSLMNGEKLTKRVKYDETSLPGSIRKK